jgi:hypothetical protein
MSDYWNYDSPRYKYPYMCAKCPVCSEPVKESLLIDHIMSHANSEALSPLYIVDQKYHGHSDCVFFCKLCGKAEHGAGRNTDSIIQHLIAAHNQEVMELIIKNAGNPFAKYDSPKVIETEAELLIQLENLCDKLTNNHGWKFDRNPAINADGRKGFILTALEPQTKDSPNVPESHSEPDRKQ